MAKTISVADDVYEWMKRKKGDDSFSDVIRSLKDDTSNFSDVNGINVADWSAAKKELAKASEKAWKDLLDE
jgi:predicted CopG family antitoxin